MFYISIWLFVKCSLWIFLLYLNSYFLPSGYPKEFVFFFLLPLSLSSIPSTFSSFNIYPFFLLPLTPFHFSSLSAPPTTYHPAPAKASTYPWEEDVTTISSCLVWTQIPVYYMGSMVAVDACLGCQRRMGRGLTGSRPGGSLGVTGCNRSPCTHLTHFSNLPTVGWENRDSEWELTSSRLSDEFDLLFTNGCLL